ncbi:hypothetical protein, partial [Azospirillum aestuarii]|uniref:hypothetical protein n=1 Tax=Azospirillum aestuarii TaxID=2802052 RepID=UPI004054FE54
KPAMDNVLLPTRETAMSILLGSTNPPQDIDATQEFARKRRNSPRCDTALSHAASAESSYSI